MAGGGNMEAHAHGSQHETAAILRPVQRLRIDIRTLAGKKTHDKDMVRSPLPSR